MTALLASVALAVFGTVVLVGYVQSAHKKAAAAEAMDPVLVVTQQVPRGTKVTDLTGRVEVKQVPASTKVEGAVASVDELDRTMVAATDLLPDEQVLKGRFETPQALGRDGAPKGLMEVTVKLDPERAVGGTLKPGDTVAVVSSFPPFDLATVNPTDAAGPKKTPNTTHVILHKVLVTNVQISTTSATTKTSSDKKPDDTSPDPAPKGSLLVTLALDATSVQQVVFTAEYGTLWLSAEPSDAPGAPTRIETIGTVDQ